MVLDGDTGEIMEYIKLISIYVGVVLIVWGVGNMFAKGVSDHKIISPKQGVECVVVSRMFNTSVDCWKVGE